MFNKDFSRKTPKHVAFRNVYVEPCSKLRKEKINDDTQSVTELFSELKDIMFEKSKLENEITGLRLECCELKKTNELLKCANNELNNAHNELQNMNNELVKQIDQENSKFEEELNKLRSEIQNTKQQLIDSGKKHMIQQKKYISEVRVLTLEKEKMILEYAEKEKDLLSRIKAQENEIDESKNNYNNLKLCYDEYLSKSNKYKAKLKHAFGVISDMNALLIQSSKKPDISTTGIQTEDSPRSEDGSTLTSRSTVSNKPEDLLLSEIFFKPETFSDADLLVFHKNVK